MDTGTGSGAGDTVCFAEIRPWPLAAACRLVPGPPASGAFSEPLPTTSPLG